MSDSALSAVAFRRALTVVVVGAIAATIVVASPLVDFDRADAHPARSPRADTVATGSLQSAGAATASLWIARVSILALRVKSGTPVVVSSAGVAAVVPAAVATGLPAAAELGDFLSQRDVRLEAIARAAAALRAEREAAAVAAAAAQAAAAAAQAAAQTAARAAATAAARAAQGFVQRVWTSGFQNEINQCRGAVDVTGVYRVRVIAEHSNCGGSRFPTAAGAIVTITGLDAGRYRVIGVVAHLNGQVNHAEDIPRGYDLLFQTCAGGYTDLSFTALQRIG